MITLTAGGITFVNQWYQTHNLDWKVPVATVILGAGVDAFSKLDSKGALLLSGLILMGALTTKFGGKTPIDLITGFVNSRGTSPPKGSVSKVSNR